MKTLLVVAASMITFFVPNIVGAGVWMIGSGIHPTLRSLTAILGWVISFGICTQVFWRYIRSAFPMSST
jgi:hypothetical protein